MIIVVVVIVFLTGFVQSPGWDERTLFTANFTGPPVRLEVPEPLNTVMVSFRGIDLPCLEGDVWVEFLSGLQSLGTACRPYERNRKALHGVTKFRRIFKTNSLLVSFHKVVPQRENVMMTTPTFHGFGFRMLFSFHQASDVPEQSKTGLWDCSVPQWHVVHQHFPCDLLQECQEGEDEINCPYSSRVRMEEGRRRGARVLAMVLEF